MTFLLILLGFLPFFFGGVQNWYMSTYMNSLPPYTLIALSVLFLWGLIAYIFNKQGKQTKQIIICLNSIAAADLVLIGIQELVFHAYWMNSVGSFSQYFYLPILNLGFRLTSWSHHVFSAYAASFLLMVGATFAGCKLKEKKRK